MNSTSERQMKTTPVGLDVVQTATLLRRYQQVHRGLMCALAGWFIAAPLYEEKHALGHHLWDHARHAHELRDRLRELRGGHPDANAEPMLAAAVAETVHARASEEFIAGAYFAVTQRLVDAYREHLLRADRSANAPEIQMIRRIIPELESHLEWAGQTFPRATQSADAEAWCAYIDGRIEEAGGVGGLKPRRDRVHVRPHSHRYERPRTIIVDERLKRARLLPIEARKRLSYEAELIEQFKVYFNEIYAAGMLASIIYDASGSDVPFDFFYDVAHQFWDEVRHSEFGMIRLRELGREPDAFDPIIYEQTESLPFLHRFAHLTLNLEVHFMARKRPRVLQYEEHNDVRSRVFADADWSDEINHVGYGKRWVGYFLEDDARTADDLKQEVAAHIQSWRGKDGTGGNPLPPF